MSRTIDFESEPTGIVTTNPAVNPVQDNGANDNWYRIADGSGLTVINTVNGGDGPSDYYVLWNASGGTVGTVDKFKIDGGSDITNVSLRIRTDGEGGGNITIYLLESDDSTVVDSVALGNIDTTYQSVNLSGSGRSIAVVDTNTAADSRVDNITYQLAGAGGGDPHIYSLKGEDFALHKH